MEVGIIMFFKEVYTYLAWEHLQTIHPDQQEPYWGHLYYNKPEFLVTFAKGGSTSAAQNLPGRMPVSGDVEYGDLTKPQHFHIFMRNPWHRLRSQLDHFTRDIRELYGYSVTNVAKFDHLPSAIDSHIQPQIAQIPIRKEYFLEKNIGKRNWVMNVAELNFLEYMEWSPDTFTFTKWGDGDDVVKLILDHVGLDKDPEKHNLSSKYDHFPHGFPAQHQTDTVNTMCDQYCTEDIKLWNWISE